MSRSRRKTPICSITCSGYNGSEKDDKQIANRKMRRQNRSMFCFVDFESINFIDDLDEVSNRWLMNKDGKMRFDPDSDWGSKLMRK